MGISHRFRFPSIWLTTWRHSGGRYNQPKRHFQRIVSWAKTGQCRSARPKWQPAQPTITRTISVNYQSTTGGYQTPTGDTIHINSPGNGSVVTPNNDNLSVNITYQSNGGGYQTPTWAYRIDSGFPAYGSPHGGTQVVGTTNRNDIFNGLSHGQRQVNVALLDQNGNLHNPPITRTISVNYQSTTGGYQTPTGDTIHINSPGNGSVVTPNNDNLSVNITYQSNGGGYQTPTWAYRIDSGFPAYGSPHGGTQVVGTTNRNDIFNGLSYGQRQVNVALLDQSGNLHNPPSPERFL